MDQQQDQLESKLSRSGCRSNTIRATIGSSFTPTTQTFTTGSGTVTIPTGAANVTIEVFGGTGGGGGSTAVGKSLIVTAGGGGGADGWDILKAHT